MNISLAKLKDIISETCVTVILNTHRTTPDNKKDPLALKNLVKEAEERLNHDLNKRDAALLIERLNKLKNTIDHSHNQESLVLFVNEDVAEYARLPIQVEERVVIDHTFATRDLIRAMHLETGYYILLLSQHKARLIEAYNERVVQEISGNFPFENNHFYPTNKAEQSNASRQTNLVAEFFNRIDKEVKEIRKEHPLPVLICTEEGNFNEYLKVTDQRDAIFDTFLNKNRLDEKAYHVVAEAWPIVEAYTIAKNNARVEELEVAVNSGMFVTDVNEIWKAILAGRVKTLFIEQGLFQPGIMEENEITLVSEEERTRKEVVDDIYDELIEINMNFGGDTLFLPDGKLKEYEGFVAVTRY